MALKVISKINSRFKFLHRQNKFLPPALRRLLCHADVQPHFDYASSVSYPKNQNNIRVTQNKCIRYCLQLDQITHFSKKEFETLDTLSENP